MGHPLGRVPQGGLHIRGVERGARNPLPPPPPPTTPPEITGKVNTACIRGVYIGFICTVCRMVHDLYQPLLFSTVYSRAFVQHMTPTFSKGCRIWIIELQIIPSFDNICSINIYIYRGRTK